MGTPNEEEQGSESAPELPAGDEELEEQVDELDENQQKRLADTLRSLMDDQRARIEYAESRRNSLATIGGVLVAAGLAALVPVAKSGWTYFPARLGLLTLAVSLIITGVTVLALWAAQTNWDYPFKKVSSTWKHFYRDAVPGGRKPEVPWHSRLSRGLREEKEAQYTALRKPFVHRTLSLVSPGVSVAQDIEQTYLLHWTELYKNRFLTSLRQVLVVGIVASLVAAGVALGVGILLWPDLYDRGQASTTPSSQTTSITKSRSTAAQRVRRQQPRRAVTPSSGSSATTSTHTSTP